MTASPGDGGHAAREGYYPDPSIPGYVRYWNGGSWVPGTSRPAPAEETGPVFLDETSLTAACPEPESTAQPDPVRPSEPDPARWQADPVHQAGFGGPRDQMVSWGQGESEHAHAASRPGGVSLGRSRPEPLIEAQPESHPEPFPEPRWESVREPAAVRASASGVRIGRAPAPPAAPAGAFDGVGILSARSPVAPAASTAPAAPAAPVPDWPEPQGSRGAPAAPPAPARTAVAPAPDPAPAPEPVAAPAAAAPVPAAAAAAAPAPAEDAVRAPRRTDHAVFERMAERAARPAGPVRRLLARAVDSVVLGAVAVAVAQPLVPAVTAHLDAKVEAARGSGRTVTVWLLDGTTAGYLGVVLGAVLLFGVFCEVLPTARWGRTLGKKLFGVRVLSVATRRPPSFAAALRRWLVFALLGLPGSLRCLGDRARRQGWHDRAAGTYVVR
ncbi:RDD family protein [Streptomyces sp. PvR034]|uniref:RDD family protein n=1 Tax=Streptomyces sp. PvR034 TaxID=3156401 RepID=UPI003393123A